jgi:hypothetical protein
MEDYELRDLGQKVQEYCEKYSIPIEYFFDILNDQKVNPMMRGKGWEFEILSAIRPYLNPSEWIIQKLNLNPQPNMPDVDVGVTHCRTGIILKVESKPAVRGSISSGEKSRIARVPHFKVKCHRSRSNKSLITNDAYAVDVFDIIITKPINAMFKGGTIGPDLEIIKDEKIINKLFAHYMVENSKNLLNAMNNDWRFVLSKDIAVNGFIPRTPYVLLSNDPNWMSINHIEKKMLEIVGEMWKPKGKK